MYIYRFKPLLKSTIWGGERIKAFKNIDTTQHDVGESWEISGVPGNESVVDGGPCDGMTLSQLVEHYKGQLVGQQVYEHFGTEFPLLIKFIDAHKQLSVQVHPDDELARRRGMPNGKTEMWYVMQSEPNASLMSGLKKEITPSQYEKMVAKKTITTALASYRVKEGDCFFLPAGRINSIGAGCMLAEIQQTSDCTYRIYDFDRRDRYGMKRELHTKQAAECIDYRVSPDYRTHYTMYKDARVPLVNCRYFTTSVYDIDRPTTLFIREIESFVILIALRGKGTVKIDGCEPEVFEAGTTLLVPATATSLEMAGKVKFLETHIEVQRGATHFNALPAAKASPNLLPRAI